MTGYTILDIAIAAAVVLLFVWGWGAIRRQCLKDKRAAEKEYNKIHGLLTELDKRLGN